MALIDPISTDGPLDAAPTDGAAGAAAPAARQAHILDPGFDLTLRPMRTFLSTIAFSISGAQTVDSP